MAKKKTRPDAADWWKEQEPIHRDEGDGQRMLWVYARAVSPPSDPTAAHEYLLVEVPDGDGPDYGMPVLRLRDGKAEVLGRGRFIQGAGR